MENPRVHQGQRTCAKKSTNETESPSTWGRVPASIFNPRLLLIPTNLVRCCTPFKLQPFLFPMAAMAFDDARLHDQCSSEVTDTRPWEDQQRRVHTYKVLVQVLLPLQIELSFNFSRYRQIDLPLSSCTSSPVPSVPLPLRQPSLSATLHQRGSSNMSLQSAWMGSIAMTLKNMSS